MAGKHILLAAELSRGTGTINRLLPLAAALAGRGHDITLALPPSISTSVAAAGIRVKEAPVWALPPPPGFLAVTYADLLQLSGYATPGSLNGLLDAWQPILEQTAPDLLIADFAPTAMLAARIGKVKQAALGDGYSLPPLVRPLPLLRPWAEIAPGAAADTEGRVLAVIDACLTGRGARGLRALRDLFRDGPNFLCTFRELDHYPTRPDGSWYGEVFMATGGETVPWPQAPGERIYIDLDARHPAIGPLVAVLGRLGLPAQVRGSGMSEAQAEQITRPSVKVDTGGNRHALAQAADIVVCQGADVAIPALLNGKPLLMLPVFVEQMMTLHRVASQGMGHGLSPDSDEAAVDAALRRLVDDHVCRQHAANFGRTYDGYRPGIAVEAVADDIEEILV
jgi:UDP:flavonoid glycosyltransferase YjiC (YdhE family)